MKLRRCKSCDLYKTRSQVVPGRGNIKSKIIFVGEAPGKDEDREGRPFIGAAGKNLNKFIKKANLTRNDIYITNTVKCKPPRRFGSNKPLNKEITICSQKWLKRELIIMQPKLIVAFGAVAMEALTGLKGIMQWEGQLIECKENWDVLICLHPASIIYEPSRAEKYYKCAEILKEISWHLNKPSYNEWIDNNLKREL